MLDCVTAIYQTQACPTPAGNSLPGSPLQGSSSNLLEILEVVTAQWSNTAFGGSSKASLSVLYQAEDPSVSNIFATNRVDIYARNDELAGSLSPGGTTCQLQNGTGFALYDQMCFSNEAGNVDLVWITGISGTLITFSTGNSVRGGGVTNHYNAGDMVGLLRYRGMVSKRIVDADPQGIQKLECVGYQSLLDTTIVNAQITNCEAGWVVYNVCLDQSAQLNINVVNTNFVYDINGGPPNLPPFSTGTGTTYNASATQPTMTQLFQDIMTTANTNSAGESYTFYLDEQNYAYFTAVNTTSPTVTASLVNPYPNFRLDGMNNIIGGQTISDNDISGITNVYYITGGQDPSAETGGNDTGQTVSAIVGNQTSVGLYGQRENAVTNTFLLNTAQASAYGMGLLQTTAFPLDQSSTKLTTATCGITCRDLVAIIGFQNGSEFEPYLINPQNVTTNWNAGDGILSQTITGQQVLPTIGRIIKQYRDEHYIKTQGRADTGTNIVNRFVLDGVTFTTSAAATSITVTPGHVVCNVNIPVNGAGGPKSQALIPTPGVTVHASSSGYFTVGLLYLKADGTEQATPSMVTYSGYSVPQGNSYADWQVLPFYSYQVTGGVITGVSDRRRFGTLANLPVPNGFTLSFSGSVGSLQYFGTGTGIAGAYDAECSFTLTGLSGPPSWLGELQLVSIVHGSGLNPITQGTFRGTVAPTSTGIYTVLFNGLVAGVQYDLYIFAESTGGNGGNQFSNALKVGTTPVNPSVTSNPSLGSVANAAPNVSGFTVSLPTQQNQGESVVSVEVEFVVDANGTSQGQPGLAFINLIAEIPGSGNPIVVGTCAAQTSNTTYNGIWGNLSVALAYNLYIQYVGYSGNTSLMTFVTQQAAIDTPLSQGSLGNYTNLIADSNWDFAKYIYGTGDTAADNSDVYGSAPMMDAAHPGAHGITFCYLKGGVHNQLGLQNNLFWTEWNSTTSSYWVSTVGIPVVVGQTYAIQAYFDGTGIPTTGTPNTGALGNSPNLCVVTGTGATTTYRMIFPMQAQAQGVFGTLFAPSITETIYIRIERNGCPLGGGNSNPVFPNMVFSIPMFAAATVAPVAYKPGGHAGNDNNIQHGALSAQVQSTINESADTFGSLLTQNQVHRLHMISDASELGNGGGTNYLFNPTWATQSFKGWTRQANVGDVNMVQVPTSASTSGSSLTLTLPSTPTPGNYMVAIAAFGSSRTPTVPSGWTTGILEAGGGGSPPSVLIMYRQVQSGDGTSYVLNVSSTGEIRGSICEMSGVGSFQFAGNAVTSGNTLSVGPITPAAINSIGLAGMAASLGTGLSPSVGAKWTELSFGSGGIGGSGDALLLQQITAANPGTTNYTATVNWGASAISTGAFVLAQPVQYTLNGGWFADGAQGGRALLSMPSGSAVTNEFYQQVLNLDSAQPNTPLQITGIFGSGTGDPNGLAQQYCQVVDNHGLVLATTSQTVSGVAVQTPFSFNATPSGNTPYTLQIGASNPSSNGAAEVAFYKVQVERGTTPSIYEDFNAAALTNLLCDGPTINADGCPISTGIITTRTFSPALSAAVTTVPCVLQKVSSKPGVTTATTFTLTPNQTVQTSSHLYAIVGLPSANTLTTPTGYNLVGSQSANGVILYVFKRESPTGTSADNFSPTISSSGSVYWAHLFEVANAGPIGGYAGSAQASSIAWYSPVIGATKNALMVCAHLPTASPSQANTTPDPTWTWHYSPMNAATAAGLLMFKPAFVPASYVNSQDWGTNQTGVTVVFYIPSAG